jgi:hypothetical protein
MAAMGFAGMELGVPPAPTENVITAAVCKRPLRRCARYFHKL